MLHVAVIFLPSSGINTHYLKPGRHTLKHFVTCDISQICNDNHNIHESSVITKYF
jgi:hypothetical protein